MTVLAVIVGAAIGAPLRFLVDRWVTGRTATRVGAFPWGLLAVNVLGSLVAGVALALTEGEVRTLVIIGFCGAFTTFSGFIWEALGLWRSARAVFWSAFLVMPIACTGAFLAAWASARALAG